MDAFISSLIALPPNSQMDHIIEALAFDIYDWTLIFAIIFLAFEMVSDLINRPHKGKKGRRLLESLSSLLTQVPYYLTELLIFGGVIYVYFVIYELVSWKMPNTFECFILVLLLADFVYYIEHFCMHKIRLFWLAHSVHHSSNIMNTATAFRFSLFDPVISATFHLPLVLMGFNPVYIFAAEVLVQAYQFWIHNEMIGKLGPLEWIFNTPSHHRVHHGSDEKYIDKNYGGILIIWDRIFGTFAKEQETPTYGLTTPMNSLNPLKVQFFEFIKLSRDVRKNGHLIRYLINPPGWQPDHLSHQLEGRSQGASKGTLQGSSQGASKGTLQGSSKGALDELSLAQSINSTAEPAASEVKHG